MAFPTTDKEWADRTSRFFKAQLKKADLTYDELAERIAKHGYSETKSSITNKLARGTFPAPFFLAALAAMGCETIRLDDV